MYHLGVINTLELEEVKRTNEVGSHQVYRLSEGTARFGKVPVLGGRQATHSQKYQEAAG
jgi:hypothetical protein